MTDDRTRKTILIAEELLVHAETRLADIRRILAALEEELAADAR